MGRHHPKPVDGPKLFLTAFAVRTIVDYRLAVRHNLYRRSVDWNGPQPQQMTLTAALSARAVIRSPFFAHVCEAVGMPFTAEEIVEEIEQDASLPPAAGVSFSPSPHPPPDLPSEASPCPRSGRHP